MIAYFMVIVKHPVFVYHWEMTKDDRELVRAYCDGDTAALAELVRRHVRPVYAFVYRMTGSAEDAEDITQEVFVRAWKNIKKYQQEKNFKTWLFAIARNASIDWLRKKKNIAFSAFETAEGTNPLVDTMADPAPLPDELFARAEREKLLDALLGTLSPIYREVLLLHYTEGLTFEEIGSMLKKPTDTVKSQHRRALIALRKSLENAPKPNSAS